MRIHPLPVIGALLLAASGACAAKDRLRYQGARPALFPDGSRLVFGSDHESDGDLYAVAPDGVSLARLTSGPFRKGYPTVSPDGKTIAYSIESWDTNAGEIHTISADGKNSTRIAGGQFSDIGPSYSPDGKKMVFARAALRRPYSMGGKVWDEWDLWIMNADGSGQQKLTDGKYYGMGPPCFSPDGTEIVFGATVRGGKALAERLFIVSVDKEEKSREVREIRLAQTNGGQAPTHPHDPRFSPDGARIVFVGVAGESYYGYDYEVWTVRPDGSGLQQITHNRSMNSYPIFSADGKAIYFMADRKRDGERELWRVGADGSGAMRVFPK